MKQKTFYLILTVVAVLGVFSMIALTAYTFYLHGNCSIISYIANGG